MKGGSCPAALAGMLLAFACACPIAAAETKATPAKPPAPPVRGAPAAVEEAIVRALDYLEGQQNSDGFWEDSRRLGRRWATAWSVLAYLANGHTARAGNYQDTVKKGLNYIMRHIDEEVPHGAGDEEQTLCFLALLSALGQGTDQVPDEDLVITCEKHLQAVIRSQWRSQGGSGTEAIDRAFGAGGWGEIRISYWKTLCLVAADQCGMQVPRVVFNDLRAFWKRHYLVAFGSYYDQLNFNNRPPNYDHGLTTTIQPVLALCLLGERESPEAQGSLGTLRKMNTGDPEWFWKQSAWLRGFNGGKAPLFGTWFVTMKLMGAEAQDLRRWRAEYSASIIHDQMENGAFRFPGWDLIDRWNHKNALQEHYFGTLHWYDHGLGYGARWSEANLTAHAAFALALPKGYLPCFTRREGR